MNKNKSFVAIAIALMLLLSSTAFSIAAETNNNLYPNPQAGLGTIKEKALIYDDQEVYSYHELTLNGSSVNASALAKQNDVKGISRLYTLNVKEEGMVSINMATMGTLDKMAKLYVTVYMNDPRNNTMTNNNDVQITLSGKPLHAYVQKNYVYYAYPGVYYFLIKGFDRSGTDYKLLNYTISATQEIYPEQYSTSMGNLNDPNYPNYLGTTTLSDSLSIKGTKSMKNWRESTTSGGISGAYTNSQDKFTFTAAKTGTVNVKINNLKTTILDTYLSAYHTQNSSTSFQPKLALYVTQPNITSPLRTECLYGQELIDTFEVKAGEVYNVELAGSNHPMKYSLDFSYGAFGSSNQSGVINTATASSWALSEINKSISAGLQTPKMMNSNFTSYATREEFAELVMKLYDQLGGTNVTNSQNPFSDTSNSEIIRAKNAGIINGISATTFGPNDNLTREQLCVMILRTLDATGTNYNMNTSFQKNYDDETSISSWALSSVRILNSYKIINGSGESLDPQDTVTKEVAILMMYRAYEFFK